MTTLAPPVPANAPRWPALIPPVLIAIPIVLKLVGVDVNNAWVIFALLIGLMLTGMIASATCAGRSGRCSPSGRGRAFR